MRRAQLAPPRLGGAAQHAAFRSLYLGRDKATRTTSLHVCQILVECYPLSWMTSSIKKGDPCHHRLRRRRRRLRQLRTATGLVLKAFPSGVVHFSPLHFRIADVGCSSRPCGLGSSRKGTVRMYAPHTYVTYHRIASRLLTYGQAPDPPGSHRSKQAHVTHNTRTGAVRIR